MAGGTLTHITDPRARRSGRDTGIARLPAIATPNTGNAHTDAILAAIKEQLEVRNGARGNDAERVVTQRELKDLLDTTGQLSSQVDALSTAIAGTAQPLTPAEALARFQDLIRRLPLYQDLVKSLNDPSRFDAMRAEVREQLLRSLTLEAQKLGASILQTQKQVQDSNLSLALQISQLTAAVQNAAAGVRQTQFATGELGRAQAGLVNQLQASLGSYYQDGGQGRASLEEVLLATADLLEGLSGQYTMKVQAGGALAGIGLSATEKDGAPDSAFIVMADKFAIVAPDYAGGLTNLPAASSIPFGVDAHGIYMNSNVYLSGTMRIQGGDKTLIDGLRGSLQLNAGSGAWSDVAASQKVWTALGNPGAPVGTAHLVIGDMVTLGNVTRYWNGSAWSNPGMVITGDLLVDGTVAAPKINTNGLTIRDANGNVILNAGAGLNLQNRLPGLGALATQSAAVIGSTVKFPDGTVMNTADFVNRLQKIDPGTIGTFISTAAIGAAYIGNAAIGTAHIQNAAVDTLRIAGGSVTSVAVSSGAPNLTIVQGSPAVVGSIPWTYVAGSTGCLLSAFVSCNCDTGNVSAIQMNIRMSAPGGYTTVGSSVISLDGSWARVSVGFGFANPTGNVTFDLQLVVPGSGGGGPAHIGQFYLMAMGAKR
ncbi:MAG: DUF1983 domain-containing protein [Burkholderiaceae bacterium]|jgi:hypothetical protein|nr:DUF1983 domain-containing protein [Burkholderiaceae bacterium]